jgi:cytoskeletal protein CcmA (bactofilin family)
MFQRKSDLSTIMPSLQPAPTAPQSGTIFPPTARGGWDNTALDYREASRTEIIDATVISDETIISSDLTIVGNVLSKGRVKLEGTIEGDMHCGSLVVGEQGSVTGGIIADEVSVYGRVAGTVRGGRVNLYSTAHVEGDIYHHGIGIEMGTHYDGRLKWTDDPAAAQDTNSAFNGHATASLLRNG